MWHTRDMVSERGIGLLVATGDIINNAGCKAAVRPCFFSRLGFKPCGASAAPCANARRSGLVAPVLGEHTVAEWLCLARKMLGPPVLPLSRHPRRAQACSVLPLCARRVPKALAPYSQSCWGRGLMGLAEPTRAKHLTGLAYRQGPSCLRRSPSVR